MWLTDKNQTKPNSSVGMIPSESKIAEMPGTAQKKKLPANFNSPQIITRSTDQSLFIHGASLRLFSCRVDPHSTL